MEARTEKTAPMIPRQTLGLANRLQWNVYTEELLDEKFRLHCIVFFLTDWTVISRAGSESVESPHVRPVGPGGGQLIC